MKNCEQNNSNQETTNETENSSSISTDADLEGATGGSTASPTTPAAPLTNGTILCTHDGVLLRKVDVELPGDLQSSGSLTIMLYSPPAGVYIEWRPSDNIPFADEGQDQEDWALVDTISKRTRTVSECKVFNMKPVPEGVANKPFVVRTPLDDMMAVVVKHRGQVMIFINKCNGMHSEFFFQHGNADQFVKSMCQQHLIELTYPSRYGGDEYKVLTAEDKKMKRTFAELKMEDMKSGQNWLTNKVAGLFVTLPEIPQGLRGGSPKKSSRQRMRNSNESTNGTSNRNGNDNSNNTNSNSDDISPVDSEMDNVLHEAEKLVKLLPRRLTIVRGEPLNANQFIELQSLDGRIVRSGDAKNIIFRGGVHPNLRADVWKFLLNYYEWDATDIERLQVRAQKSSEYYKMKAQWLAMTPAQEANFSGFRDRKCQIEKDVKRTDRSLEFFAGEDNPNLMVLQGILMTYVMYNFDLGYVQGMSDLLAPILAIQGNEVDAFWCFVGFMDMVFANFDIDQAGMKKQFRQLKRLLKFSNPRLYYYMVKHDSADMFFCFRWLVVWYKREFSNEDVLTLWEALWSGQPCPNFHLFVSLAILDQHTDNIINNKYEFTEILKHINELAYRIDLKKTLEIAEAIYYQVKAAPHLTNDIRKIIGEPIIEGEPCNDSNCSTERDFPDELYEVLNTPSPDEEERLQRELEDACDRSEFLTYV